MSRAASGMMRPSSIMERTSSVLKTAKPAASPSRLTGGASQGESLRMKLRCSPACGLRERREGPARRGVRGVKAGEFGVEPRLLMEFAQHGFGGRFARGDEACGEIVPEAGTDRLGEASLLKEQAAVGCEGEKPHDDGGESECAEDRAFGAGDDAAAGISHVEELEGALLGEAVVCKSGRQGRKRGLEALGAKSSKTRGRTSGARARKFGIRAQGA